MAYFLRKALDTFWSPTVWLPPNTTWADIAPESSTEIQHADHRHLWYPIPLAFVMLLLRYLLEKYWFAPVGLSIGIKNSRPKKAPPNPVLEKAYSQSKKWKHKQIQGLAKQLDMTERQVERWLRLRKGQNKPSTLTKFCENSWRCLYYTFSFIFGITILWSKSWLWDINECWKDFPHQSLPNDIWWYYIISMSFYWSLCVSQFFDVKRKDFWQMFIHHIATIVLMVLSWIVNVFRIGSLVLVLHDCADIFLEGAKMAKYSGYQKVCDVIFAIFTVLWIITRVGIFPFWIIYNTSIKAPQMVPMFPAYYIFNSLLCILLVLHIFWTYLILKIVYNSLNAGQMEGDIRSSSEDYSVDSNNSNSVQNHTKSE
ncbi:ceramide synthase 6 [Sitophilus oryzae]|uniref:Ceramide synthase 6 n=1 Tax=Sitophilus oryzae TaxID=7048 RepID=A0A6J2Y2P9_SITOR|nr:ceramide synthase 6 [Sitophilus oryzae]XP_030757263.1 ceramide synthase 6 [Sitophilus oryzae]XP_030757264.1 ceramide synthase 6 [Sitophilus oryzae]XP_030757265.1 ceramide synthase 6 [Sitophilus oryzae]